MAEGLAATGRARQTPAADGARLGGAQRPKAGPPTTSAGSGGSGGCVPLLKSVLCVVSRESARASPEAQAEAGPGEPALPSSAPWSLERGEGSPRAPTREARRRRRRSATHVPAATASAAAAAATAMPPRPPPAARESRLALPRWRRRRSRRRPARQPVPHRVHTARCWG